VVTGKWLFHHKLTSDGSLDRYKARWVLRGFTQRPGVDYDETFSPVVKFATVRDVLSLALSRDWVIHQLDIKNAFLHGTLTETVYYSQPTGFIDAAHTDLVYQLNRSLYGLKQAPQAWYSRFASYLASIGFVEASRTRPSSSIGVATTLSTSCSTSMTLCSRHPPPTFYSARSSPFNGRSRWTWGPLHHFLGITVER
jgi:hypothetical protein